MAKKAEKVAKVKEPKVKAPKVEKPAKAESTEKRSVRELWVKIARFSTGLIGTAVVIALALTLGTVVWPSFGVSAPVTVVNPAKQDQKLVCAGPLLTQGTSLETVGVISSVAPLNIVSRGERELLPTADANAGVNGAPSRLSAPIDSDNIAGTVTSVVSSDAAFGLATSSCVEPAAEQWLVATSTEAGRQSLLIIANPSDVAAEVAIEIYERTGLSESVVGDELTLEAGETVTIPITGFVVGEPALVVHVVAKGGLVGSFLQLTQVDGLVPDGVEIVNPGALPSKELVIPGVLVDATQVSAEGHEGDDGVPTLVMLAPTRQANATVRVQMDGSAEPIEFTVALRPGSVSQLALTGLATGTYDIRIDSDAPVVAGAQTAVAEEGGIDVAWFAASERLAEETVFAVAGPGQVAGAEGVVATLHFSNTSAAAVTVQLRGVDERSVDVPAGGSVSVEIPEGVWEASGTGVLHGSISMRGIGRIAATTLQGPSASSASVPVYTR